MTASRARLLHIFRKSWNVNSKRIVEKVVPPCRACQTRTLSTSVITRANKILGRYPVSPLRLRNWIYISGNEYATGSKGAKVKDIDVFEESLTPEETEKVLKLVNEVQQSEDLLKYIIPKKKAEELIKRRNESDKLFTSLDQLSVIIGPKNSSKFYCSVLSKPIPVSMNAAMYPLASAEEVTRFSKVLSIIVVGDKISWCLVHRHMDGPKDIQLSVESVQQLSYPFKPRMHFLTLLNEMKTVVTQLPEAELYIVEEYPATVPTPYMFNFQLQMAQARSMVLGILSSRLADAKIISLKTVAVARSFNTYIGSEKVSGQYLVEDMLINQQRPFLRINESQVHSYMTADAKVKEGLSQALLLNFAYWKLTQQVKL